MKIALVGAAGKLGGYLRRAWERDHEVIPLTRAELDLRDGEAVQERLGNLDFEGLVNAAAMSSPEACEADPEGAGLVNAVAPGIMARSCTGRGARMVHFSTDYVVEGGVPGLKDETAPVGIQGNYASSKLQGERGVLEADPHALVCRVSWVFGAGIPSFLDTVIDRLRGGGGMEAVTDKWSKPTSARDIADSVERLLAAPGASGVLHLVNAGEPVTWWDYASRAADLAVEAGLLPGRVPIGRCRLADVPQLSAPRPVHTALGSVRQGELLGADLPHWEERVREELAIRAAGECH